MHIFAVDETNKKSHSGLKFFMLGGLIFPPDKIVESTNTLNLIKDKYNLSRDKSVSWNNKHCIDSEMLKNVKKDILRYLSLNEEVKYLVYFAPNDFFNTLISNKKRHVDALKMATNVIHAQFNRHLKNTDDFGMILFDEDESIVKELNIHCNDIHLNGLDYNGRKKKCEQIPLKAFHVKDECSELLQISDIALGALQHSIKEFNNDNFVKQLKNNLLRGQYDNVSNSFKIYPKSCVGDTCIDIKGLRNKLNNLF